MAETEAVEREYGAVVLDFPAQSAPAQIEVSLRRASACAQAALPPGTRYEVLLSYQGPQGWYALVGWYSSSLFAGDETWRDQAALLEDSPPYSQERGAYVIARRTTPRPRPHQAPQEDAHG